MEDKKFDEEEPEGWVKEEEKRNKVGLKININKRKLNHKEWKKKGVKKATLRRGRKTKTQGEIIK